MSWAAIIGQPLAVRLLRRSVAAGKVAHAYLFVGLEGVGKRTVALELAKALNCLHPRESGEACDNCNACRKLSAVPSVHPDLSLVAPDGKFIKTDQIRALQAEMYARPNEGKVRIAIIDAADRMNPESGNRLLKLLEEPPAYAVLILLTSNLSGVLPTLISRCQVVNFTPLSPEEVASALRVKTGIDAGQAHLFASLSGGSIGRAMVLAEDAAVAQRREEAYELLRSLPSLDDFALLGQAESLEKQKENLTDWLELLTVWLRDALIVAQTGSDQLVINADRIPVVRELASRYGPSVLLQLIGTVMETVGNLQRNANTRLMLDVMMLRMSEATRQDIVGSVQF